MDAVLQEFIPPFIAAVLGILTTLAGWLSLKLQQKWGIDAEAAKKAIEAGNRQALHWALETAAKLATDRGYSGGKAIGFMLEYLKASSPEALKQLAPSRKMLEELAEAKIVSAKDDKAAAIAVAAGAAAAAIKSIK